MQASAGWMSDSSWFLISCIVVLLALASGAGTSRHDPSTARFTRVARCGRLAARGEGGCVARAQQATWIRVHATAC